MPRAVRIGRAAPVALLLGLAVIAAPHVTQAQTRRRTDATPSRVAAPAPDKPGPPPLSDEQALKGSLDTRLAYIVTGDKEVDDLSKAGLEGLSEVLRNRTSVEPADPVGLDLEKDEPRLYPLIYWPITSTPAQPLAARLGRARPLPAHRRHPVHRHARPADVVRPQRQRQPATSSACCPASRCRR